MELSGEFMNNFTINFNKNNYINPPLLFTCLENTTQDLNRYTNDPTLLVSNITNKKFEIKASNIDGINNYKFYVYVINNDNNNIQVYRRNLAN